jgi:glycosyltransferase involved in cell wall biosynthesis
MSPTVLRSAGTLQRVAIGALALLLALAWIVALRDTLRLDPIVYALAALILSLDVIDLLLRLYRQRGIQAAALGTKGATSIGMLSSTSFAAARTPLRPYAFVLSVHNLEATMDEFLAWALVHRERMWIVDDCSTDNTALRLRAAGLRCLSLTSNVKKPAALRALLAKLPADIHTVIVVDPDCEVRAAHGGWHAVEACLLQFQDSGAAALCPRIDIDGHTLLESMQRIEYLLGFCFGRRSLGDFCTTAGLAIYRRDALESALAKHSLSVYAEDLENTLHLLGSGQRIYYDDRIYAVTQVPCTLRSWFSQRVGWYFGLAKVYMERWKDTWEVARRGPFAFYQYVIYLGGFSLLLLPFRIASCIILALSLAQGLDAILGIALLPDTAATNPLLFSVVFLKYLALVWFAIGLVANNRERAVLLPLAPLYFFYVLLQVIPATIGCCNWLTVKCLGQRLYNDHYDSNPERNWVRRFT